MKLRSMDLILDEVLKKPTELISHTVAISRGYKFLCADIDVDTFFKRDCEVETPTRNIIAIVHSEGTNFYAKP